MNAYEQNQQLIEKFRNLVASGKTTEASELYDSAGQEVAEDVSLGRFGSEAVAIAKANGVKLNDSNVAW